MFILSYIYIQCIHLISVTLVQKNQSGEQIKKKTTYFCRFQICRILLNQHRQLTNSSWKWGYLGQILS